MCNDSNLPQQSSDVDIGYLISNFINLKKKNLSILQLSHNSCWGIFCGLNNFSPKAWTPYVKDWQCIDNG